jgi:hypothetical protein
MDEKQELKIVLIEDDVRKAASAAVEYGAKFGNKVTEEIHARCHSDDICYPPVGLVHSEFDNIPLTALDFAVARMQSN